jgi:hypothetical protein
MKIIPHIESTEDWQSFFSKNHDLTQIKKSSTPVNCGIGNMFGNQANYTLPLSSTHERKPVSQKVLVVSEAEASVDRAKSELSQKDSTPLAATNLVSADSIPFPSSSRSRQKKAQNQAKQLTASHSPSRKRTSDQLELSSFSLPSKKHKFAKPIAKPAKKYTTHKKIF